MDLVDEARAGDLLDRRVDVMLRVDRLGLAVSVSLNDPPDFGIVGFDTVLAHRSQGALRYRWVGAASSVVLRGYQG